MNWQTVVKQRENQSKFLPVSYLKVQNIFRVLKESYTSWDM